MPAFYFEYIVTYRRAVMVEADTEDEARTAAFEGNGVTFRESLIGGPMADYDLVRLECDCADRSWYGPRHDSACDMWGIEREKE